MKADQQPLNSGYGAETMAAKIASGVDLRGKVWVITGGHSGIGLETTPVLAEAGAFFCVGARDMVLLPAPSASLSLLHPYNYLY
jgi:NADP-dependent 3-hydroxy acid dehydrogenase YdfG